jgi:hypothetical protein
MERDGERRREMERDGERWSTLPLNLYKVHILSVEPTGIDR